MSSEVHFALIASNQGVDNCVPLVESYASSVSDRESMLKTVADVITTKKLDYRVVEGNEERCAKKVHQYLYTWLSISSLIFVCVTDIDFGKTLSFVLLREISQLFMQSYGTVVGSGKRLVATTFRSFVSELDQKRERFSGEMSQRIDTSTAADPTQNKLQSLNRELEDVKSILRGNTQALVTRGVELEDLSLRSESMNVTASQFSRSSRQLRQSQGCLPNPRHRLVAFLIGLLFVYVLASSVCGLTLTHCSNK